MGHDDDHRLCVFKPEGMIHCIAILFPYMVTLLRIKLLADVRVPPAVHDATGDKG